MIQPTITTPSRDEEKRQFAIGLGVLLFLVIAAYSPAMRGGFVWDDTLMVERNPLVLGDFNLLTIWFRMDFPLSTISCWLQWLLWGKNATGFHVVNILLHAANCILLWRILARLKLPAAWLAAALFAVHPVGAASVAWITEIKNTLSLLFFLVSFRWFLMFGEQREAGAMTRSWVSYALSLVAFVLALFSKTSTVMLPVVLLGLAWWRRGRIGLRDVLLVLPHFALGLTFGLMTVWFQKNQVVLGVVVQDENFWGRLAGAGRAVWFYLGKAILPVNLCAVYPRWTTDPRQLLSWLPLFLIASSFVACWCFRKHIGRHALFALGCFVALLFPVLGFFDMYYLVFSRVSDHFAYLTLMVVATVVAAGLGSLLPKTILRVVGAVLIAALVLLTFQRATVYTIDEKLWRDTVAKNPNAWNAQNNLGCILAEQEKIDEAMALFLKSVELNPRNASAQCNLGKAFLVKGSFVEAETHFRAALDSKPNHVDTLKAYGGALAAQGRRDEAVRYLSEAVRTKPDNDARLQLAALLATTGRSREAAEQFRAVLARDPKSFQAMNNLGWILATSADASVRDGNEAMKLALRACELSGGKDATPFGTLGAAYAEMGQFTNAIMSAQQAVVLANKSGNANFARMNQQLMQLYRAGRPYHELTARPTSTTPPH